MQINQFSNNAQSTLAGDITAGATALTVASAASFPSSGNFTIIVDSEIMLVTAVAGATFTVSRAQESTVAAPHPAGATVQHVVTAAWLNAVSTPLAERVFTTGGNVGISSSTFSDVTALMVTLPRPMKLTIHVAGTAQHGTPGTGNYLDIDIDGVRVSGGATDGLMRWMVPVANYWVNISFTAQSVELSEGVHTIKLQARTTGGGATYHATNNQPLVLHVTGS